jgi:hypothetical protein
MINTMNVRPVLNPVSPALPDFLPNTLTCAAHDWAYSDRRNFQEIIPRLFLGILTFLKESGPYTASRVLQPLVDAGITHVLIVRHPGEAHIVNPKFPTHFVYHIINIKDQPGENIVGPSFNRV